MSNITWDARQVWIEAERLELETLEADDIDAFLALATVSAEPVFILQEKTVASDRSTLTLFSSMLGRELLQNFLVIIIQTDRVLQRIRMTLLISQRVQGDLLRFIEGLLN